MIRKITSLFTLLAVCSASQLFSQVVGGRENGQSSPKEVTPATLSKGSFTDDVNLFNGTLDNSYSLGSVSTPSGLSYSLSLNYNTTSSMGDNITIAAGIPYGDGWNVNIPTISIEEESYYKYTESQLQSIRNDADDNETSEGATPDYAAFTEAEAQKEGELYWFSPRISIPGVINERFIFKYYDGSTAVFVPNCFDEYVEARFAGQVWTVITSDGTQYLFDDIQANPRNSANQRVLGTNHPSTTGGPSKYPDPATLKNDILPKFEIVSWYCSTISNPEHSAGQEIVFNYEKFGEFNYYKEFSQERVDIALTSEDILSSGGRCIPGVGQVFISEPLPKLVVHKDLLLKSVYATSWSSLIETIDLKYKTKYFHYGEPTSNMLFPGQTGVDRLDSLYNYKTVYSVGLSDGDEDEIDPTGSSSSSEDFDEWWRYNHIRSDNANSTYKATCGFASETNPYIFSDGTNSFYDRNQPSGSGNDNLAFNHGFLESPRIGNGSDFPAGDIYEIRTYIHNGSEGTKFCNYDINIATGSKTGETQSFKTTSTDFPNAYQMNKSKSEAIFSTFNQPIKWNTYSLTSSSSPYVLTSNFFTLPNLPTEYEGFNIQVGPANSDHKFSLTPEALNGLFGVTTSMDANRTYYNFLYNYSGGYDYENVYHPLEPCDPIPNNFGIGLSWQMMSKFYSEFDYSTGTNSDLWARQKFWWNDGTDFDWPNTPTAAGPDVELRAVQMLRYSKNPYMLAEVDHYKVNGEIDGITNPGLKLVSTLSLDYTIIQSDVVDNKIYEEGSTVATPWDRNIFVLSSIKQIPVDPSNPGTTVTYDINEVPTTRFEYTKFDNTHAYWITRGSTNYFAPGLSSVVGLTKITDQLGGVTEYDYYPVKEEYNPSEGLTSDITSHNITVDYYVNYSAVPSITNVTEKPHPYNSQIYLCVKTKKVHSESEEIDADWIKKWSYDYQEPVIYNSAAGLTGLGNHFRRQQTFSNQLGFKKTIVTEPVVEAGVALAKTNYYHYGTEDDGQLFGKLYKVENVDELSRVIKKTETEFTIKLAYKNGSFEEDYLDMFRISGVIDYDYWPLFGSVVNGYSVQDITWSADQPIRMLEGSEACEEFPDLYLNSYFIAKTKETVTDYDYYPLDAVYHVVGDSKYSGQVTSARKSAATCSILRYGSNQISTVTDYLYWDASYDGLTSCPGYRILLGTTRFPLTDETHGLNFEPSWQLYSKKTYSAQLPDAFNKEEFFYYYDVINDYDRKYSPGFDALYHARIHNLRGIAYEKRTTSKAVAKDPISASEYYWYTSKWNYCAAEDEIVTVAVSGPADACDEFHGDGDPSDPPVGTGTAPEDCIYVHHYVGQAPPIGYVLHIYNGFPYFCPGAGPGGSRPRSMTVLIDGEDPNDPPPALPNSDQWINGKLKFKRSNLQVDNVVVNPDYTERVTGENEYNILRFNYVHVTSPTSEDVYFPEYPFDTLMTYEVEKRNALGQVTLEKDEKNLVTKYDYTLPHSVWHVDAAHWCNNYSSINFNDIGVPSQIISGFEAVNDPELPSSFTYYPDYSINTITDPNSAVLHYAYDEYGRLKEKYLNSQLITTTGYHMFENTVANESQTFAQRTNQNYVENYTFNESSSTVALHSRAYMDPLGRTNNTLSQISPDASTEALGVKMVYAGETVYDNWSRVVQSYKPFIVINTGGAAFDLKYNHENTSVYPQETSSSKFESNSGGRLLRRTQFGENITSGHSQDMSFRFIKGTALAGELGLTTGERAAIVPGTASNYMFEKKFITDEDGKKSIEYTNVFGQKVASKQYINALTPVVTLFIYDSKGNVCKVINPLKQESTYEYNLLGWMYRKTTVDGGTSKYMFNHSGQVVMEQDANGSSSTDDTEPYLRLYNYNEFGKMISQSKVHKASTGPYDGDVLIHSPLEYESYDDFPSTGLRVMAFSDASTCDFSYNEKIMTGTDPVAASPYDNLSSTIVKEKEWKYSETVSSLSYATSIQTYLTSNAQAKKVGRLSYTTSYDPAGTAIDRSVYSYNNEGRPAYEIHEFKKESTTIPSVITYPEYNLQGNLKEQDMDTDLDGGSEMQYVYNYDDWNRLSTVTVNDNLLSDYTYDDALGLLTEKKYYTQAGCSVVCDNIINTYDVRNRLTSISSQLFSENLYYDSDQPVPSTTESVYNVAYTNNYNGNINGSQALYNLSSTTNYGTIGNIMDGATFYGYSYDGLNRLISSNASVMNRLSDPSTSNPALKYGDESYTYDKIGNISNLKRGQYYGPSISSPANQVDDWNYSYVSGKNRLSSITSGSTTLRNYTYDDNGNARTDDYTAHVISSSMYSRENLPASITANGKSMVYLYNSADNRIYKENTTDDIKEYYLQDASGKTLGIYDLNSTNWVWYAYDNNRIAKFGTTTEFFEYDHLGNERTSYSTSVSCSTSVVSYSASNVSDYYPYGKILRAFAGSGMGRYGYQSSEREKEISDNDYYTHFRGLDAEIGRWKQFDPKWDESWSPYSAMNCNPVRLTDILGDTPGDGNKKPKGTNKKPEKKEEPKKEPQPTYNPPPKVLPGFPDAQREKPKDGRPRWRNPDGDILEWDRQHGEVERYNPNGKHKGVWTPEGEPKKEPVPGRKINNPIDKPVAVPVYDNVPAPKGVYIPPPSNGVPNVVTPVTVIGVITIIIQVVEGVAGALAL